MKCWETGPEGRDRLAAESIFVRQRAGCLRARYTARREASGRGIILRSRRERSHSDWAVRVADRLNNNPAEARLMTASLTEQEHRNELQQSQERYRTMIASSRAESSRSALQTTPPDQLLPPSGFGSLTRHRRRQDQSFYFSFEPSSNMANRGESSASGSRSVQVARAREVSSSSLMCRWSDKSRLSRKRSIKGE